MCMDQAGPGTVLRGKPRWSQQTQGGLPKCRGQAGPGTVLRGNSQWSQQKQGACQIAGASQVQVRC